MAIYVPARIVLQSSTNMSLDERFTLISKQQREDFEQEDDVYTQYESPPNNSYRGYRNSRGGRPRPPIRYNPNYLNTPWSSYRKFRGAGRRPRGNYSGQQRIFRGRVQKPFYYEPYEEDFTSSPRRGGLRGRWNNSRGRGRGGRSRGAYKKRQTPSKEVLDKQIDEYMARTKIEVP